MALAMIIPQIRTRWLPLLAQIIILVGTNFWKRIHAHFPGVPKWELGKFVSGTINCLVKDSKRVIVSLDFETESYRQLLLHVVTSTFCVLRDCLSIVSNSKTFSDVLLMKSMEIKILGLNCSMFLTRVMLVGVIIPGHSMFMKMIVCR